MLALPAVWALTYVSVSLCSMSRLHAAEAFAVKAMPARAIEQIVMVNFIPSLFIMRMPL